MAIVALGLSSQTLAAKIADQTLIYKIEFQGKHVGELEVVINSTDRGYQVRSISRFRSLAAVLLKNTTIESSYALSQEQLRRQLKLTGGKEILNHSGEVKRSFTIDYAAREIAFSDGQLFAFSKATPIDADAFPLRLMWSGVAPIAGKKILAVSPKRAREYQYQPPKMATVTVAAGKFDSVKLRRIRLDNPAKSVTIWLTKQDNPMPLKIVTGEADKQTTLTLLQCKISR